MASDHCDVDVASFSFTPGFNRVKAPFLFWQSFQRFALPSKHGKPLKRLGDILVALTPG
jgi:hypothetical protein